MMGTRTRAVWPGVAVIMLAAACASAAEAEGQLTLRLSWGHRSPAGSPFHVQVRGEKVQVAALEPVDLEPGEALEQETVRSRAGAGDVDGAQLVVRFPRMEIKERETLNSMWADLLRLSDADTSRRLRSDPGYRPDPRRITVQMNPEGTLGFSLTVDQLMQQKAFWAPTLDVFISTDPAVGFEAHQRELDRYKGRRVLDQVEQAPEASYEQFTARWEDMASPRYAHPSQPAPGHIICVGWDSSLAKFGIDRGGGAWPDLGNPDRFRTWFDFARVGPALIQSWRSQCLLDGLPIITTVCEQDGIRYEIEQYAYPLDGPPAERRGDIPMVLMQGVRLTNLRSEARSASFEVVHERPIEGTALLAPDGGAFVLVEEGSRGVLLTVQGKGIDVKLTEVPAPAATQPPKPRPPHRSRLRIAAGLPANGSRQIVLKLPSPVVSPQGQQKLLAIDHARGREATVKFWSDYLARGAQFTVPEKVVNDLFRANLWHALRLPRRHGGPGDNVRVDLPYSNFAYGQDGTPWPINQAVYVDYMLYDLRGHHELSAEELAVMFRNNQKPTGHVGGYANWVVYTPSMVYCVARHFQLSGDRASFERLLPATLKAADWCLEQIKTNQARGGASAGLVDGPLNDLTEGGVWAFSQAYIYAALDCLARALKQVDHPRAEEFSAAARDFRAAVGRAFANAAMRSPLVQLRDHTWCPYVPTDALVGGRMMAQWYPTDVDTGAMHLPRLGALDSGSPLVDWLLHDHEDNLYLHGWGMANEPVYNPQATAYLLRDQPKPVIRAFYSMLACAFSHSALEPVEHRWTWGQYFGPPSTDGAWFELYRNMLIREVDDDTLLLLQATPRKWLEDGKRIEVQRAPTHFGPLSMKIASEAGAGRIVAQIEAPDRSRPASMLVRLRHPEARPLRKLTVNGLPWADYDPEKEWLRIRQPGERAYRIVAEY